MFAAGHDGVNDGLFKMGPPLGPKKKLIGSLGTPLCASFAPEHAPRTLSGPSTNRKKRKTKILKSAQFFPQNSHLGHLLPIQDPPKGPPLDLIKFPEGLLGGPWGAKCTSQDPPWTLLEIPQGPIEKKRMFF